MSRLSDVDSYLHTVARLEPDIHPIDASASHASQSISLRRIADGLDLLVGIIKILAEAMAEEDDVPPSARAKLRQLLAKG